MKKILLFLFTISFIVNIQAQEPTFESFNIGQSFTTITVDKANKKVWAGTTQNGVFNLDINPETLAPNFTIFNGADPDSGPDLSALRIKSMAADAIGNIWIGHEGINSTGGLGGMERIDTQLNTKHFSAETNYISQLAYSQRDGLATRKLTSVSIDKNNKVWTAHKYTDLTSGSTYLLQPGAFSYKGRYDSNFTTNGGWWPNTSNQPDELPYPAYTYNTPVTQTPQARTMDAISSDATKVWVSVRGYLKRGNTNTTDAGYVIPRILEYDLSGTFKSEYEQSDIFTDTGGVINAICLNDNNGAWVTNSATGRGFSVYKNGAWVNIMSSTIDSDGAQFSFLIPENTRFNANAIWKDKIGRVFMGTDKGLIVYNGHGDVTKFSSYKIYTDYDFGASIDNTANIFDTDMISSNVLGGYSDPNNSSRHWIATDNGIMKLFLPIDGVIIYNVKDHSDYSSITVDGDFSIRKLAKLANELTEPVDNENTTTIAADGAAATVIRIYTDDPEGFYDNNINQDGAKYHIFLGTESDAVSLNSDDYKNRYGSFELKVLGSYEGYPTTPTELKFIEVIYTHPKQINSGDYVTDQTYAEYDFVIKDVENNTDLFKHPLKVSIPPILLGHGVWSDNDSMKNLRNSLIANGIPSYAVKRFWKTSITPERSFSQDAGIIPSEIKDLKEELALQHNFSAGKINFVTHSRGGLFTRAYIEEIDPNFYYRDNINSLITINTPHSGAQGANFSLDKRTIAFGEAEINTFVDGALDIAALFSIQYIGEPLKVGTIGQAIAKNLTDDNWGSRQLLVEGDQISGIVIPEDIDFIKTLNATGNLQKLNGIPIHAITSVYNPCEASPILCNDINMLNSTLIPKRFKGLAIIYNAVYFVTNEVPRAINDLTTDLYGEENDFVVPLSSMQAGLGTNYNTQHGVAQNYSHSDLPLGIGLGVCNGTETHSKVNELLKSNVHDQTSNGQFSKDGINPPELSYNFMSNLTPIPTNRDATDFNSKIFINRDPAIFDNVSEGDILNFNVYQDDVDRILVTYENEFQDLYSQEFRDSNLSFENGFGYTIPQGFSGELKITAYGFNDNEVGLVKNIVTLNVGIPGDVTLQSIHFEQEEATVFEQENYTYNLIGLYSDGVERNINNLSALTLDINNGTIISQVNNTTVLGTSVGSTLLTANLNGLEDSITVNVIEDLSLYRTIVTGFYGLPADGNSSIDIFWDTLREFENETFVLESSYNAPDNFTEVNQQPGNGTTTIPTQFSYSDTSFGTNTIIYYRLKMINTLGEFTYSSIIQIDLTTLSIDDSNVADFGLKLFPNPVSSDNVNLTVNANISDQNAKLEIYNLQGKRLSFQSIHIIQGSNTYSLKLKNTLSNGIYLVRVSTNGFIKTLKLVVNK